MESDALRQNSNVKGGCSGLLQPFQSPMEIKKADPDGLSESASFSCVVFLWCNAVSSDSKNLLLLFFSHKNWCFFLCDCCFCDDDFFNRWITWDFKHDVHHRFFNDGA